MSKDVEQPSNDLRKFMFERVYFTDTAKAEEERAERMLGAMYSYFIANEKKLPETYLKLLNSYDKERVVCDYLSSMTDRYAEYMFKMIFMPKGWTFNDEGN